MEWIFGPLVGLFDLWCSLDSASLGIRRSRPRFLARRFVEHRSVLLTGMMRHQNSSELAAGSMWQFGR